MISLPPAKSSFNWKRVIPGEGQVDADAGGHKKLRGAPLKPAVLSQTRDTFKKGAQRRGSSNKNV